MFSSKSRYAIRIMTFLASRRNELVAVSELSDKLGISSKYLEQIMTILRRAGYVEAVRGALGGYKLAVNPENCRVGDILRLMEVRLEPAECVSGHDCASEPDCAIRQMWIKLWEAEKAVLDSYTIARLAYNG